MAEMLTINELSNSHTVRGVGRCYCLSVITQKSSLATRLYCVFTLSYITICLHLNYIGTTVGHFVHKIATRGGCDGSDETYFQLPS